MAMFGALGEFDREKEPWTEYTERLEQFFVANQVEDVNRRRAIFLTVVGSSTYSLLRNLIAPTLPTQLTLAQLLQTLTAHFEPPQSAIVLRFKFNSRLRRSGETVPTFIAELRCLAKDCNYGNTLDEMLRDRLVCGINDESIQRRLLAERDLTLARATEIAVAMEAASRNAEDLRGDGSVSTAQVNVLRHNRPQATTSDAKENGDEACYCCGEKGHWAPNCYTNKLITLIYNFITKRFSKTVFNQIMGLLVMIIIVIIEYFYSQD